MKRISATHPPLCLNCVNCNLCFPGHSRYFEITEQRCMQRDFLYFEKDAYLFKRGEAAKGIFCIFSGCIEIIDSDGGLNRYATDGECIGFNCVENGYFTKTTRSADDSFCCFIKSSEVELLLENGQPISERILNGY